jgi:hypothetical protein
MHTLWRSRCANLTTRGEVVGCSCGVEGADLTAPTERKDLEVLGRYCTAAWILWKVELETS